MSMLSQDWSKFDGLVNPEDVVIRDVRIQSNAGWYVGAVQFYNYDEMDFYSRDTGYYPSEEMLSQEYPQSISIQEAFHKVKHDRLYSRKMDKYLAK